jgi:hypothetical protein
MLHCYLSVYNVIPKIQFINCYVHYVHYVHHTCNLHCTLDTKYTDEIRNTVASHRVRGYQNARVRGW